MDAGSPTSDEGAAGAWLIREGPAKDRRYDLGQRLLTYASAIIDLSEMLPDTRAANHVAGQILRSGTSPLPNHGEAEAAESRADFIHKLKLCLKELRETHRWARLIALKRWCADDPTLLFVLQETDELVRIFARSIHTAETNRTSSSR